MNKLNTKPQIAQAALNGLAWLTLQSLGGRIVGLLSQLALAWFLSPSNFGIIGLVYAITNIANAIVNFGVDNVLLQRQRAMSFWVTPTFWTSLGLGCISFVLVLIIAPVSALIYHSSQLAPLAAILALSMPIGALATVPTVIIRSRLDFQFISIYRTVELVLSASLTVALAWRGFGAYSFVIPTPIFATINVLVFWLYSPVSISRRFRWVQVRFLLGSGLAVFSTRLIIEAISQGDYVILGLTASKAEVGIYYFAFRLAAQPIWIIAGNFSGVLLPALMALKGDEARQLKAVMLAVRMLAYVAIPACILQSALADPLLRMLFGKKWISAIPVMQVLSLGLAFDSITWITGTFLSAKREYLRSLKYYSIAAPAFFACVYLGSIFLQAPGAALGVTVFYVIMGPTMACVVLGRLGVRWTHVLALFMKPTILAAPTIGIAAALSYLPILRSSQFLRILETCIVGSTSYLLVLRLFERRIVEEIIDRLIPGRWRPTMQTLLYRVLLLPDIDKSMPGL